MTSEEYLLGLMPTEEMIERFLDTRVHLDDPEKNNMGRIYHPTVGFLVKDNWYRDAMDGGWCLITFDPAGARTRVNFPGRAPRINSYGNSFTLCNCVNDGESWQEYLGAHIGEPVANYGIGGYSVYQAYLRVLREEEKNPAQVIIFNIWEDDHYRSLDAWKSIRRGSISLMGNGFAMPYLIVEADGDTVREHPNPTPTAQSVRRLADRDWVMKTFNRPENLPLQVAVKCVSPESVAPGVDSEVDVGIADTGRDAKIESLREAHTKAALRSSEYLVDRLVAYAEAHSKKLLFVLSYGPGYMRSRLEGKERWDQTFVDFLRHTGQPVVDISDAHLADFQGYFGCSLEKYLNRFFIGHYSPVGNHFLALAVKDQLVELLDPKPPSYRAPRVQ